MSDPAGSETRLRTTFNIKVNGKPIAISTVGQAYQFPDQSEFGGVDGVQVAA